LKVKRIRQVLFLAIVSFYLAGCTSQEGPQEKRPAISLKEKKSQAQELEKSGNLLAARKLYKEIFAEVTNLKNIKDIGSIKKKVEELNMKILFSKIMDKGDFFYEVEKGDTLGEIAKKFGTTVELIKRVNGLKSNIIMIGDRLKIGKAKFSMVVYKSQNLLFLKRYDEIFKTYIVSTGVDGSTPTGTFKIVARIKNPVWFRKDIGAVVPADSPENILGTRWLGISKKGYGIHGTNQPETLGTQETKGCIRMRNEDVEEVFDIVPRGTEVIILE